MMLSTPEYAAMPIVNCLGCGSGIELDATTYVNYLGPATCATCRNQQNVRIENGQITYSEPLKPNPMQAIIDLFDHEVPQEIIADLIQHKRFYYINGHKGYFEASISCQKSVKTMCVLANDKTVLLAMRKTIEHFAPRCRFLYPPPHAFSQLLREHNQTLVDRSGESRGHPVSCPELSRRGGGHRGCPL